MIFSSIEFIIFFIIFVLLIFKNTRNQQLIIIISSIIFYAFWEIKYILLLFYIICTLYFCLKKNLNLFFSITLTLLPLLFFKYLSFFINLTGFNYLNNFLYPQKLPLGISFITFTAIALLVDNKKKIFTEKLDFSSLTEFIVYFPQLIAGPILRAHELVPLLKKKLSLIKKI